MDKKRQASYYNRNTTDFDIKIVLRCFNATVSRKSISWPIVVKFSLRDKHFIMELGLYLLFSLETYNMNRRTYPSTQRM